MSEMTTMENTFDLTREAYDRYLRRGIPTNVLSQDDALTSGYQLPEGFNGKLISALNTVSVLRPLCTEITTSNDDYMPIVNGHGKADWVPENSPSPIVRDAFDRVPLDNHKLAATIRVTAELLKDSAVDIEQYLANTFADRMAVAEEDGFLCGNGVDKPLGLIQQTKTGCMAEGTVSLDDVLNLVFSVPEKYRRNATLLMNDTTLLGLYRQAMAQGNQLLFGKMNDGRTDTFFGLPIVRCAAMPDAQPGSTPILCGNFKQVFINNCGKRGIKRLNELYAGNAHVGFLLAERVGIRLVVPDAVKALRITA